MLSYATEPAVTAAPPFSPVRIERLRSALQRHVDGGELPGLVAAVSRGEEGHFEVLGTTSFGQEPMRRDAIFRLASNTKPITAAGVMILVEECRLRLDDPVDGWLPEMANRRVLRTIESPLDDTVPAVRRLTVRDLLTYRSGYGEVMFLAPSAPYQRALSAARLSLAEWPFDGSPDEFMRRLGELPLAHQPGERWLYHTSGEILGVLLARVTGRSLGAFLEERIFGPLGMADTGFHVPAQHLHRLPPCYGTDMVSGELVRLYEQGGGYAAAPPPFESGAGGLVSTADDLLAFGRMMLMQPSPAGERILSRPTIELMTRDHLSAEQKARSPFFEYFWETYGWGLGMGVITAQTDVSHRPGRFGWDGAFGTSWYVDPKEELVGVLMTQRRPDQLALPPVTLDFWTSVYQLIEQ